MWLGVGFCAGVGVTLMGLLIIAGLVTAASGVVVPGPEPEPRICDLASLDP